jgi:hypothetical protein
LPHISSTSTVTASSPEAAILHAESIINAPGEHLNDHRDARLRKAHVIGAASPGSAGSPPHQTAAHIMLMCAEMVEMAQVEANIACD